MEQTLVNLEEFLRSGEFGPVRIGLDREGLLRLLGEPERLGGAAVWRYGDVELHLDPERVFLIFAEGFAAPKGGLGLALEPGWVRGGLSLEVVMQRLVEMGIHFVPRVPEQDPGQVVLELDSGVLLGFVVDAATPGPRGLVFFSQGAR